MRNPNYNDEGNGNGVYRPLVCQDVDNREWLLDAGSDFHPQHSDKKQDWTTTTAHVFETMLKIPTTEKKQITGGSLYLVGMPWTSNTWRASVYRMTAANGAAGSADVIPGRLSN